MYVSHNFSPLICYTFFKHQPNPQSVDSMLSRPSTPLCLPRKQTLVKAAKHRDKIRRLLSSEVKCRNSYASWKAQKRKGFTTYRTLRLWDFTE
jgi:hypothetical protein